MDNSQEFEEYFRRKLMEEGTLISHLSEQELRQIYQMEFELQMNAPVLDLKLESQDVQYEMTKYYLPQKWEMLRPGKLLYDDEELLNALKLIIYNVGVQKTLDIIPKQLIENYLRGK
ncbi:hypothetical protein ACP26L_17680 [Paenibacillus sp. S-38]|uniref:hypothetical protein n=1 Tax=Paenibacillus sp. S-38 TaxID=3416710 RepID=UPI003CF262D8